MWACLMVALRVRASWKVAPALRCASIEVPSARSKQVCDHNHKSLPTTLQSSESSSRPSGRCASLGISTVVRHSAALWFATMRMATVAPRYGSRRRGSASCGDAP